MNIIVCVKHVPQVSEVDLRITPDGRNVDESGLVFDVNEWDEYALEEALRIKESRGGEVTVITVGDERSDETLRKCLAKGADKALRITDPRINLWNPMAVARVLAAAVSTLQYDLIFVGAQSSDDGYGAVGPALAGFLGIPYATLVKEVKLEDGSVIVRRELEGGMEENLEVKLPALLSIQTGINEPRYVSIMGVRRAMRKPIKTMNLEELGLDLREITDKSSWIEVKEFFEPPAGERAEIIEGSPEEVASKIIEILKSRGIL